MASIQDIQKHVDALIAADEPRVLEIYGKWGIGKTYAWKNIWLDEALDKNRNFNIKYGYVSLLGLESLAALKDEIIVQCNSSYPNKCRSKYSRFWDELLEQEYKAAYLYNVAAEEITKQPFKWLCVAVLFAVSYLLMPFITDFINLIVFFLAFMLLVALILKERFTDYNLTRDIFDRLRFGTRTLTALAYKNIDKSIICIDDFERKSEALSDNDVLGLISNLKEHKKCKIVLLMNEKGLEPDAELEDNKKGAKADSEEDNKKQTIFHKLREKIVDKWIEFTPTTLESFEVAFQKTVAEPFSNAFVKERCIALGLSNIRIFNSIRLHLEEISSLGIQFTKQTAEDISDTLVLYNSAYLNAERGFPSLSEIRNYNLFKRDPEQLGAEVMERYGWLLVHNHEYDDYIAESLRSGFFDKEQLEEIVEREKARYALATREDKHHKKWAMFHESLEDNEGEFLDALFESAHSDPSGIRIHNYNATIRILREFKREKQADDLIEAFVSRDVLLEQYFEMSDYSKSQDITDDKFREELEKKREHFTKPTLKLSELMEGKTDFGSGWKKEEIDAIHAADANEFEAAFKQCQGAHLRTALYWIYR